MADKRFILFEGRRYNLDSNSGAVFSLIKSKSSFANRYAAISNSLSKKSLYYLFQGVYSSAELELRLRELDNFFLYIKGMLETIVDVGHDAIIYLERDDQQKFMASVASIGGNDKQKAFLNYIQGVYFLGKYSFNLAIPKFLEAIKLDPKNLKYRNELVFSYIKLGDFEKAREESGRSLRQEVNSGSSELAICYAYLMIICDKMGEFEKAKMCEKKAESLGINRGRFAWDNFRYAKTAKLLGDALYCWGKYEQARNYYSNGLTLNSRMLKNNRSLLLDLDLLCSCCDAWLKTGKIGKAAEYAEKAHKYLASWVKGKSFRKAWISNLKGRIKEIRGDFSQAAFDYRAAVVELEGSAGSFHIVSSVIYADYARCNLKGHLEEFVHDNLGKGANACKSGEITKDDDKFNSIFAFARISKNLRNYETAIKFYKRAIKKYTVEFGKVSFKVFTAQKSLAKCYFALQKKAKTRKYILAALYTYRSLGLPAYPEVMTLYILYGDLYFLDKNIVSAIKAYEKSLLFATQNFGSVTSLTVDVYRRLCKIYEHLGVYDKAISYFNKVLTYASKNFRESEEFLIDDYEYLGSLWEKSGNMGKAEQYYFNAYQSSMQNLGVFDKRTVQAKKQLERVIEKMDKR